MEIVIIVLFILYLGARWVEKTEKELIISVEK